MALEVLEVTLVVPEVLGRGPLEVVVQQVWESGSEGLLEVS